MLDAPHKPNPLHEHALAELCQAYDDAAAAASRGEVRTLPLRKQVVAAPKTGNNYC